MSIRLRAFNTISERHNKTAMGVVRQSEHEQRWRSARRGLRAGLVQREQRSVELEREQLRRGILTGFLLFSPIVATTQGAFWRGRTYLRSALSRRSNAAERREVKTLYTNYEL